MTINYLPIYKTKPGELKAVANTKNLHASQILPLFEICRVSKSILKAARFKNRSALTCAYLDETAEKIAEVRKGYAAIVDGFQWRPDSTTETGEHIMPYMYSKLRSLGVDVIPVIGYDRWDSEQYRIAMQSVEASGHGHFCMRLDSHAFEDAEEPEYFEDQLSNILNDLDLKSEQCIVLMDFGDITALSVEDLIHRSARMMNILIPMGFKIYATAGCSLPSSIDKAVKQQNSIGKVMRKEMLLWQTLRMNYTSVKWLFGDYGVRGPNTAEDVISPHTNGKIRYTINLHHFIVRGHSMQMGDKGAQMYKLAKIIVDSPHYMGEEFSWGDAQILACSREERGPGNSTNWITIDTCHHVAWVLAEVEEFEHSIAAVAGAGHAIELV